jgi:hypothetical protein
VIDLDRLHGEVSAPRLASNGKLTLVALQEATAGGHQVRLGRLADSGEVSDWVTSPHQAADESSAFDVAVGSGRALLVWDEWSASENRGSARIASIELRSGAAAAAALRLSDDATDAESPRIVPRADGFWVTWIANAPLGPGERQFYDPDRGEETAAELSQASLSHGARWLEALAVDDRGRASSRVLRITPADARVVGYDLIATEDGEVLVVWRQGAPSPSADGGQIAALRLTPGGPGDVTWIREGELGAGSPALIPSGLARAPWLTFPDSSDALRLLRLSPEAASGPPSTEIALPWTGSVVLAAGHEQPLLVALPRAHGVELSLVRCAAGRAR